jgi:hypothetical protein
VPTRTPSRPLRVLLALIASAFLLVAVGCGNDSNRPSLDEAGAATTVVDAPVSTVDPNTHFVATSTVQGKQEVFESPQATEAMTTLDSPTAIGAPLVFLVKEDLGDWLNVYLPIRPNGSSGYVRASDVELTSHDFKIEVRLADFNLKVYDGDDVFLDAPIAVAADNYPTPGGIYYTTELLQPPNPAGDYGPWAYGLSGYSDVLENFNGGPGQLGIHGTNQPELIGTKVSHGCIRLRNEDIDQLAPVLPLGVPVEIIT